MPDAAWWLWCGLALAGLLAGAQGFGRLPVHKTFSAVGLTVALVGVGLAYVLTGFAGTPVPRVLAIEGAAVLLASVPLAMRARRHGTATNSVRRAGSTKPTWWRRPPPEP